MKNSQKIAKENIIKATAAQNKFLKYTLKLKNIYCIIIFC